MLHGEAFGLLVGAVALGAVHGAEPGHGWPVAASYALDQTNKWIYGLAASVLIGVGHLVSSIAMVGVFFYAKSYFNLTQVNEPMTVLGGVQIGGPVSLVAGVLLVLLGVREYRHGHSHGGGHGHHGHGGGHDHDNAHDHEEGHDHHDVHDHEDGHDHHDVHDHVHDGGHAHDHGDAHSHGKHHDHDGGVWSRVKGVLPFVGGHSHDHGDLEEAAQRGLLGIAWFAFLLGFAHEEEFEIIALCAGSNYCLQLMTAYALTVIVGIVALTLLLIAGFEHYEERAEAYAEYLPAFSAAVLILMGLGFILGVF